LIITPETKHESWRKRKLYDNFTKNIRFLALIIGFIENSNVISRNRSGNCTRKSWENSSKILKIENIG
jgi:hypothetical protein